MFGKKSKFILIGNVIRNLNRIETIFTQDEEDKFNIYFLYNIGKSTVSYKTKESRDEVFKNIMNLLDVNEL